MATAGSHVLRRRQLGIESLESRRTLSANPVLADGVLTVQGTALPDQIEAVVIFDSLAVRLNNQWTVFKNQQVTQIRVFAGAGNDTLWGNLGNDQLQGGAGNDSLFGGWGDDRLDGGENDDFISGDAGRDDLNGGTGRDTVLALDGEVDSIKRDAVEFVVRDPGDELHLI